MSEKTENTLRMAVFALVAIVLVLIVFSINSSSQYNQNDHLIEQGKLPVYVNPPHQGPSNNNGPATDNSGLVGGGAGNQNIVENTEPVAPQPVNKNEYAYKSYKAIFDACSKVTPIKIKATNMTVYSVLKLSDSILYDVADEDGNYYTIVDATNSGVVFETTDVIDIYCAPVGMSKMNGSDIPRLKADLIEKVG